MNTPRSAARPARSPACRRLAAVAAAIVLGAGCRNGSGDAGAPPGPVAPELLLEGVFPQAGTTVATGSEVLVAFGEDMDAATLLAEAFVVSDGSGELAGRYSYDSVHRTWTFRADRGLPLGSTLRARLTTALRSSRGAALPADFEWQFQTALGSLAPAVLLGDQSTAVPTHVVRRDGELVIAHDRTIWEVGSARPLATITAGGQLVGLSMSEFGAVTAMTAASSASDFAVALLRRPVGAGWQAPQPVAAQNRVLQLARLHGNSRGDMLVRLVHRATGPSTEDLLLSPWDAPEQLQAVSVADPSLLRVVALDGVGGVFHGVPGAAGVRVLRSGAAGALDLPLAGPGAELIDLRADGNGCCVALYRTGVGAAASLRGRRYCPERGLEAEQVLFAGPHRLADFVGNGRGDIAAVWTVDGAAATEVYVAAMLGRQGVWSPASLVVADARPFLDNAFASAAISPRGAVFVAFVEERAGGVRQLLVTRAEAGGVFALPLLVDTADASARFSRPALAADAGNRLILAWQQREVTGSAIGPLRYRLLEE